MYKLDLHVHTQYSEDAVGRPEDIIQALQQKGINGVAITDHNTVEGALYAQKVAPKDFLVIPGIEISTFSGHILGLNVTQAVPRNLSVEETVEHIRTQGGTPVVPHVFRRMSGIKKENLRLIAQKIPAMEVFNGCSFSKTNIKTARVAREFKLGGTGGSDTHDAFYAGYAYTVIPSTELTLDSVMTELEKKTSWGEGATMPVQYRKARMTKSIKQFFRRGFKRI
jgi:hypothetical protein